MIRAMLFSIPVLTGCSVSNGQVVEDIPNPFCDAAADIALVVASQCVGMISQPDLAYPSNAQELEAWLPIEFADERDTLIVSRADCVPARPWQVTDLSELGVDCVELGDCMAASGVVFPSPFPAESFRNELSECRDPSLIHEDDDGDGDPD